MSSNRLRAFPEASGTSEHRYIRTWCYVVRLYRSWTFRERTNRRRRCRHTVSCRRIRLGHIRSDPDLWIHHYRWKTTATNEDHEISACRKPVRLSSRLRLSPLAEFPRESHARSSPVSPIHEGQDSSVTGAPLILLIITEKKELRFDLHETRIGLVLLPRRFQS